MQVSFLVPHYEVRASDLIQQHSLMLPSHIVPQIWMFSVLAVNHQGCVLTENAPSPTRFSCLAAAIEHQELIAVIVISQPPQSEKTLLIVLC